jgi:EAL domain-containing protein (putative c-di-GMP-specific phosphodiesterase class I)/FixJ family two-component response regulator
LIGSARVRSALVVDDDAPSRERARAVLSEAGFTDVACAADGADALRLASRDAGYDLLVCDVRGARMDGIELMRHLARQGFDGPILLTGGTDRRLLESVTALGREHGLTLAGSMPKPLERCTLEELLSRKAVPPVARTAEEPPIEAQELRDALERDEIDAHFQPKFRVSDGGFAGAEALARWRHPVHGLVGPARFVHVAERLGLVGRLTERMLACSLECLRRSAGSPSVPSIAVNLSPADLQDLGFVERLCALVREAGVSPARLVLEVTENRLMADAPTAVEVLTRLRLRGFGLAIDDFGTGWSSFALLAQIPFDELKVDARFVRAATFDDTALAIVEASVDIARRLGMSVVAEGVETPAHWEICRRCGIDLAQGFMLGRAMPRARLRERYLEA